MKKHIKLTGEHEHRGPSHGYEKDQAELNGQDVQTAEVDQQDKDDTSEDQENDTHLYSSTKRGTQNKRDDQQEPEEEETEEEETEEDDQDTEEGEEDENEEGAEEEGEEGQDFVEKVKGYLQNIDQEKVVKYASAAIVGIYGIRKGGIIGSLLVAAAAAVASNAFGAVAEAQDDAEPETEEAETMQYAH